MMMKLKTVLTLLLAAVMLLSLCACGGDADVAVTPSPTPAVTPIPDNLSFTVRFDEVPYYTAPLSGIEYTVVPSIPAQSWNIWTHRGTIFS